MPPCWRTRTAGASSASGNRMGLSTSITITEPSGCAASFVSIATPASDTSRTILRCCAEQRSTSQRMASPILLRVLSTLRPWWRIDDTAIPAWFKDEFAQLGFVREMCKFCERLVIRRRSLFWLGCQLAHESESPGVWCALLVFGLVLLPQSNDRGSH